MTNLAPDLVPTGPLCGSGSSWHQSDVVGYQHHPHIRFPLEIIIRIKNFIVNHLSEHSQDAFTKLLIPTLKHHGVSNGFL